MEIKYKKYINTKNNRVEFLLINYDYIDGNDYIARLFQDEYGFVVENKTEGLWYSIIRIHLNFSTYELLWHEDVGNAIYSLSQTDEEIETLQNRLDKVMKILNSSL